jgi:hypothetical protein
MLLTVLRVGLHAFVATALMWFATCGTFTFDEPDDPHTVGYQMLADAFLDGTTALPTKPSAELLALPDPYDPVAHAKLALVDASLFNGRYYLYFNPLPALPRAAYTYVAGTAPKTSAVVFTWSTLGYVALLLLASRLRSRVAPRLNAIWVDLIVASIALGGAWPSLVARPSIYTEAILAASAFGLAGIALIAHRPRATSTRVLASLCIACAVACRISFIAYAAPFVLWLLIDAVRSKQWRSLLAAMAPMFVVAALLMTYNVVRFGNPLEYGGRFQLTGMNGALQRIDPRVIADNAWAYVFYRPGWSSWFPFHLSTEIIRNDVEPKWVLEGSFAGVLWIAPLALLCPAILLVRRARRRPFAWIAAASIVGISCLLLLMGWAAIRYAHDMLPLAMLFGSFATISFIMRQRQTPRAIGFVLLSLIAFIASAHAVAMGINELNIRRGERGLRLALAFDRAWTGVRSTRAYIASARAARPLGDAYWTPSELRPPGLFIPNRTDVQLDGGESGGTGSLQIESLARDTLTARIFIDGADAGSIQLAPGWNTADVSSLASIAPHQRFTIRIEADGSTDRLLPMLIRGF